MANGFHVVVCAGIVPDPLQLLVPVQGPAGPALKNELMLPHVLDPWAAHALFEAAHLARQTAPGSRVILASLAPKTKLQQVLMNVAQKAAFELVTLDAPTGGFADAIETAAALADLILAIPNLDRDRLLLFGGWESASRGAGATLQIVGERLGIREQFQGVDRLVLLEDGPMEIEERIEGGRQRVSRCAGPPAVFGWATGHLPWPTNNPQVGMLNMRTAMPALQRAARAHVTTGDARFLDVSLPTQRRETRVVKDLPPETIAREIVDWIAGG